MNAIHQSLDTIYLTRQVLLRHQGESTIYLHNSDLQKKVGSSGAHKAQLSDVEVQHAVVILPRIH